MNNPQPVQILVALTKERSGEIREALKKMKIAIDENDIVDLDIVDLQKLKMEIAKATPARRIGVAAREFGTPEVIKEMKGELDNG